MGAPPAGTLMHPHHPQTQDILHDNIVALNDVDLNDESATSDLATSFFGYSDYETRLSKSDEDNLDDDDDDEVNPAIEKAMNALKFVAQHVKNQDNFNSFADDWKYVAMVLDRILLWFFTVACVVGTAGIIMAAPSHYDARQPIDVKYSKIDQKTTMRKTQLDED